MTNAERNAEILAAMRELTAIETATPELARAALIRRGIYTPEGNLRPEYGGEPDESDKNG